jgi:hypothetical protein
MLFIRDSLWKIYYHLFSSLPSVWETMDKVTLIFFRPSGMRQL